MRFCIVTRPAEVLTFNQSRQRENAYTLSFRFITIPSSFNASNFSNSLSPQDTFQKSFALDQRATSQIKTIEVE
jgi:hypothetical protein